MALIKHIKHVVALGAVVCATSVLAVSCGDDTTDSPSTGNGKDAGATTLDKGVVGKACASTSDCGGGTCATSLGLGTLLGMGTPAPGGYCTIPCSANSECGEGGVCSGAFGATVKGQCQKGCESDTDCRDGYSCADLSQVQTAVNGAADAGLPVPDGGTDLSAFVANACTPVPATVTLDANTAGKACTEDADCGKGTCFTELPFVMTPLEGGYCTGACLEDSQCGAGGACRGAFSSPLFSIAGTCFKTCKTDSECRGPDFVCTTFGQGLPAGVGGGGGGGQTFCLPPAPVAGDAGTDAGNTTTDAGSDAGTPDAGGEDDAGDEADAA